jgi:hypothetical protein
MGNRYTKKIKKHSMNEILCLLYKLDNGNVYFRIWAFKEGFRNVKSAFRAWCRGSKLFFRYLEAKPTEERFCWENYQYWKLVASTENTCIYQSPLTNRYWAWIHGIDCRGSVNTLEEAYDLALEMESTQY